MSGTAATLKRQLGFLRAELQIAIEIELTTVPPYLAALYSIPQDANRQPQANIRAVVLEEMLHMTLAANVLNAVGGRPRLGTRGFVPGYPMDLPWHEPGSRVSLARFSLEQIEKFRAIEAPKPQYRARGRGGEPPPEPKGYKSIGEFYAALIGRLQWLVGTFGPEQVFTGDPELQVSPEDYYGADGAVIPVRDLGSAIEALSTVVREGEGTTTSVWDGDHDVAVPPLPAHFYLFDEIVRGRRYRRGDTQASGPRGETFKVDWNAAYPMRPNPKREDYAGRHPEIFGKLKAFDERFLGLLDLVNEAFNGRPDRLRGAAAQMYDLRYAAVELMRIPDPLHPGQTVGPSFGSVKPTRPEHGGLWRTRRSAARPTRSPGRRP
jgi:hypothetical protein